MTQLEMFRQTIFGHLLDTLIIFNGKLVHYILLREVNETRTDAISFELLGKKVSFRGSLTLSLVLDMQLHLLELDTQLTIDLEKPTWRIA